MEAGGRAQDVGLVSKDAASLPEASFQLVDRVERFVGQGFIAQRPQVLGRLHLGRVGRLELEDDAVGDGEVGARVPAGAIQGQQDHLIRTCALLLGEGGQHRGEDLQADARHQVPGDAPARRVDEADQVHPLVAVPDPGVRPLPCRCPDAAQDRLQADAVLIRPPGLPARAGVPRLYVAPALRQALL